jgi:hypothetical protein
MCADLLDLSELVDGDLHISDLKFSDAIIVSHLKFHSDVAHEPEDDGKP